uniref:N-acetylglucosaminyl-phosphatidylinositol de-N-acetylase-like n=1 Tax=Styela clava TaxID=7725 RepID=UPI0019398689|nr:N-acetylglucosaminyl-phosphatidylinositol de-N-acetylase-like [Styela clava]
MLFLLLIGLFVALVATFYARKLEELDSRNREIFDIKQASDSNQEPSSVLFVTSHPDDECMFFGPTLNYLVKKNLTVHILCLSTGNYYGLGETRRVELLNSCLKLGITPSQVHQLDQFPDNLKDFWAEKEVATTIDKFVNLTKAKAIFTFDEGGVSCHPNHISACKGALAIKSSIPVFKLTTVNTIRKYIQVLDILPSSTNEYLIVSGSRGYRSTYNAMLCHKSQLAWFRRLYMIFSRYMFINTWTKVERS